MNPTQFDIREVTELLGQKELLIFRLSQQCHTLIQEVERLKVDVARLTALVGDGHGADDRQAPEPAIPAPSA